MKFDKKIQALCGLQRFFTFATVKLPCTNKHYYCMFNGITVTTSDIIDEEYKEYICVRFERPNNNNGFDFAEIIMPDKKFIKAFGFSEDELYWIESFAADNLLLMWEMAKESKQIA